MIAQNINNIISDIPENVKLIAISKTKPNEDIMTAYKNGHRFFGENKIQEMSRKFSELPKDINWHMVGHVQLQIFCVENSKDSMQYFLLEMF